MCERAGGHNAAVTRTERAELEQRRSGLPTRSVCVVEQEGGGGDFHASLIASEFRANLSEAMLLEQWQCDFSPVSAALFSVKLLAPKPLAANTAF